MIVSVLWPAWEWARDASESTLFASYDMELVLRDAVKCRNLIRTEWYRRNFMRGWDLTEGQDAKGYYTTTRMGERRSVSVGSGTGWRCRKQVIDDPLKADDAYSEAKREAALVWLNETMPSRLNDMATGQRVLIMQRLHERDPSGWLLEHEDWEHVKLPARYETKNPCECKSCKRGKTSIGWRDPRTQDGELLFPAKFSEAVLAEMEVSLGPLAFAGQAQQRPTPAKGGMLKPEYFTRRWLQKGETAQPGFTVRQLPVKFDKLAIVVDCSFKKTSQTKGKDTDPVAAGVCGLVGPDLYVIDCMWGQMGFLETQEAIRTLQKRYNVRQILIEDAANGPAVIETLQLELQGVLEIPAAGGKEARVAASEPVWAAGNVWLPQSANWGTAAQSRGVEKAVAEAVAFPKGAHDDWIDMMAHAVLRLVPRRGLDTFRAYST